MWIAKDWKDYELLDCGGGEKLERWDRQVLVRPDPQAIWETDKTTRLWRGATRLRHRVIGREHRVAPVPTTFGKFRSQIALLGLKTGNSGREEPMETTFTCFQAEKDRFRPFCMWGFAFSAG